MMATHGVHHVMVVDAADKRRVVRRKHLRDAEQRRQGDLRRHSVVADKTG